jgi:hypothetical protein
MGKFARITASTLNAGLEAKGALKTVKDGTPGAAKAVKGGITERFNSFKDEVRSAMDEKDTPESL